MRWGTNNYITKTYLYNVDPLEPYFYIVKLGFTGVYIISLIPAQNIDCGYPLEPPRQGGSNEYPQFMFWAEIWKISDFLSENFHFLVVQFSVYLNRRIFVMIQKKKKKKNNKKQQHKKRHIRNQQRTNKEELQHRSRFGTTSKTKNGI